MLWPSFYAPLQMLYNLVLCVWVLVGLAWIEFVWSSHFTHVCSYSRRNDGCEFGLSGRGTGIYKYYKWGIVRSYEFNSADTPVEMAKNIMGWKKVYNFEHVPHTSIQHILITSIHRVLRSNAHKWDTNLTRYETTRRDDSLLRTKHTGRYSLV